MNTTKPKYNINLLIKSNSKNIKKTKKNNNKKNLRKSLRRNIKTNSRNLKKRINTSKIIKNKYKNRTKKKKSKVSTIQRSYKKYTHSKKKKLNRTGGGNTLSNSIPDVFVDTDAIIDDDEVKADVDVNVANNQLLKQFKSLPDGLQDTITEKLLINLNPKPPYKISKFINLYKLPVNIKEDKVVWKDNRWQCKYDNDEFIELGLNQIIEHVYSLDSVRTDLEGENLDKFKYLIIFTQLFLLKILRYFLFKRSNYADKYKSENNILEKIGCNNMYNDDDDKLKCSFLNINIEYCEYIMNYLDYNSNNLSKYQTEKLFDDLLDKFDFSYDRYYNNLENDEKIDVLLRIDKYEDGDGILDLYNIILITMINSFFPDFRRNWPDGS